MCWEVLMVDLVARYRGRIAGFLFASLAAFLVSAGLAYSQWSGNPKQNSAICVGPGDKWSTAITADGSGGAILVWQDDRNGNFDIFAQKVDFTGKIRWTPGRSGCMPGHVTSRLPGAGR